MTLKKYKILVFCVPLFLGCKEKAFLGKSEFTKSNFDYKSLYGEFSSNMKNNDTLNLGLNLSICGWREYDEVVITKRNSQLFFQLKQKTIPSDTIIHFPEVRYIPNSYITDLETMIKSFDPNCSKETGSPFFIISSPNKNDSLLLYTEGLEDRGRNIEMYNNLLYELYPKQMDEYYLAFFGKSYKEFN